MIKKAVVDTNTPSIVSGKKAAKSSMGERLTATETINIKSFKKLATIK